MNLYLWKQFICNHVYRWWWSTELSLYLCLVHDLKSPSVVSKVKYVLELREGGGDSHEEKR